MTAYLKSLSDSEIIHSIQQFAGTAWMQISSLANEMARSGPVLDLAGITLCGLIIVYLVVNRVKYRQYLLDERLVSNFRSDFSAEVITRMIGQQTENSFATIVRAIYNERERLQNWAQESLLPAGETLFVSESKYSAEASASNDLSDVESAANHYHEISKLAAAGMGVNEIASLVKRPQAEIELCLSLERRRVVNGDETGTENIASRGKNFRLISGNRANSQA